MTTCRGEPIITNLSLSSRALILILLIAAAAPVVSAQSDQAALLPSRPIPFTPMPPVPEPPVVVLSEAHFEELEQWMREFSEWETWTDRWLNRREPGKWAYAVERRTKPEPPEWLDGACQLTDDDALIHACALLEAWRDDVIAGKQRRAAAASVAQEEAPSKSAWWQHLHFDALWSTTQANVTAFGLLGAHVTMEVEGRLQVFVAPGILLVSVPSFSGSRELWPATDWGATYRMFSVGRSTVHFNLVHAWILGGSAGLLNPNMTLAGFSVTFRPPSR